MQTLTLFSLLCVVLSWRAHGHIQGIAVLGDPATNRPASFEFGAVGLPGATSAVVTTDGNAVSVLVRGGATAITLAPDVAKLPSVAMGGELSATSVSIGGVQQWSLLDIDTFDEPGSPWSASTGFLAATPWSLNDRSFCSTPHDQFLGGHCLFGASQTSRTYSGMPQHTRVRIRARVHFIDRWNGEAVTLSVGGFPVWSQSHAWCTGFLEQMCVKLGVDTCGKSTPDKLSARAEAMIAHTGPNLEISFASSLPQDTDACETSWGVDDVSVEVL